MRLIGLGIAPLLLAGLAAANAAPQNPGYPPPPPAATIPPPLEPASEPVAPPSPESAPAAQATTAAPATPYRRCTSAGRGFASTGPCALRANGGEPPQLQVRIERNLNSRPAALLLIWSERDDLGGDLIRLTPRSFATAPATAGTILPVAIPNSYCRPNARRFTVELELADGRNLGTIGHFSFPCAR